MPTATMENDGGKPEQKLPPAFRPAEEGTSCVDGLVEMWRENVRWRVVGYELESGRVFAQLVDGSTTAWLQKSASAPVRHEPDSEEPCCACLNRRDGFRLDPETDLWVHAGCNKPTSAYLAGYVRRMG